MEARCLVDVAAHCPVPTLTSTVSISDAARLLMEEGDTLQQEEHE